nr:hypothetical protein [Tanacetum cinerariifolium]
QVVGRVRFAGGGGVGRYHGRGRESRARHGEAHGVGHRLAAGQAGQGRVDNPAGRHAVRHATVVDGSGGGGGIVVAAVAHVHIGEAGGQLGSLHHLGGSARAVVAGRDSQGYQVAGHAGGGAAEAGGQVKAGAEGQGRRLAVVGRLAGFAGGGGDAGRSHYRAVGGGIKRDNRYRAGPVVEAREAGVGYQAGGLAIHTAVGSGHVGQAFGQLHRGHYTRRVGGAVVHESSRERGRRGSRGQRAGGHRSAGHDGGG